MLAHGPFLLLYNILAVGCLPEPSRPKCLKSAITSRHVCIFRVYCNLTDRSCTYTIYREKTGVTWPHGAAYLVWSHNPPFCLTLSRSISVQLIYLDHDVMWFKGALYAGIIILNKWTLFTAYKVHNLYDKTQHGKIWTLDLLRAISGRQFLTHCNQASCKWLIILILINKILHISYIFKIQNNKMPFWKSYKSFVFFLVILKGL